jgi:uncharacterized membrane protein
VLMSQDITGKTVLKHYTDAFLVLSGWLVLFLFFAGAVEKGFLLFLGFVFFAFVPGFVLQEYLLPEYTVLEKSLLASFLGVWLIPLLMYYASVLGIKAVSLWFSFAVIALCLVLFILKNKNMKFHNDARDAEE